jgi:hypothetical protein
LAEKGSYSWLDLRTSDVLSEELKSKIINFFNFHEPFYARHERLQKRNRKWSAGAKAKTTVRVGFQVG